MINGTVMCVCVFGGVGGMGGWGMGVGGRLTSVCYFYFLVVNKEKKSILL